MGSERVPVERRHSEHSNSELTVIPDGEAESERTALVHDDVLPAGPGEHDIFGIHSSVAMDERLVAVDPRECADRKADRGEQRRDDDQVAQASDLEKG